MKGGSLIREARRRARLTQEELATRLGTKQPVIARWESNDVSPRFENVVRAIRACGLDLQPRIAVYDFDDDIAIQQFLWMSPRQRLRSLESMLETEATMRTARRVR